MARRPPSPVAARPAPAARTRRDDARTRRDDARPRRDDARRAGTRPAGARAGRGREDGEPRPARLARVLSVRALVLGMVLLAGFTLLFPTVRAYLAQRAELAALAGQVAAAEQAERDLQRELDRWEDDAYVAAQARERLSYVLPGETAYRVIDPEVVVEEEPEDGPEPADGPTLPDGGAVAPWYATVWDSLAAAGASGPEAEE